MTEVGAALLGGLLVGASIKLSENICKASGPDLFFSFLLWSINKGQNWIFQEAVWGTNNDQIQTYLEETAPDLQLRNQYPEDLQFRLWQKGKKKKNQTVYR